MQNLKYLNQVPTGLSYLLRRERNWGQPLFFTIETINSCNFRCIYCPQSDQEKHFINGRGIMSLGDFKRVIANLRSAFNVRSVSLHRDGEPLLNKHLEAYVSHLTELRIHASFSSNCSLLTEQRARSLITAGLRMVNTDFCADATLYEKLRVRGVWKHTYDGICNLLRAAVEAGSDFHFVIKDISTHQCPPGDVDRLTGQTRGLFSEWADRVSVMPVHFHNALGESIVNLAPAASDDAGERYTLCHHPWVNFTVDFAGRVVGCCRDLRSEYVLGNLLEEPAAQIWNGDRMRRLRGSLIRRRPEEVNICRVCDVPWQGSYSGRTALQKIRNFFFAKAWKR
jgi:radical SAM protein with 4Fe4S-binding SPASM domain